MPLFRQAPSGRRNRSPETRSSAGGGALLRGSKDIRGCPDRQRSDRSAAMQMLQCNMKCVPIVWPTISEVTLPRSLVRNRERIR